MTQVDMISLHKTYRGSSSPVLEDFSLSVQDGELVALLGPSGSGKSTLLKLISGIEIPDSGDVQFDGVSILRLPPNQRGAVFVFQKSYLFPFLSIAENIAFGLKVKHFPADTIHREVARMLDLIGLPGIEKRKPAQLSGGEQQRVALARALITQPRLLLLDEPLSSLDTEVRLNLQEAIRRIQRELKITTIFVTHDLGEAMAMSDRMAILLRGKVAAIDQPETLFHRPPCQASAQFVGMNFFIEGEVDDGWLNSPLGRLRIDPVVAPGRRTFAIRPEHIRLGYEKIENTLPGQVRDCVFRGEYVEYQVLVGSQSVRARMPMPAPLHAQGDQVFVWLPAEYLFELSGDCL